MATPKWRTGQDAVRERSKEKWSREEPSRSHRRLPFIVTNNNHTHRKRSHDTIYSCVSHLLVRFR
ncbi:hypothetical protein Bca52824_013656 [Brassica carinata]|uniref:Uncharacterized protein n=1 Tax=Brassica carinata TaxID=52824 RepID=A0A8X7W161_BRACI|nr:hypothetical protein Bca52824_013656 [Brassica carinata]